MIDVLLTHSYHLQYDSKQVQKMQPYRPLGTLYAAAALRAQGFTVALFDTMLRAPEEFTAILQETSPRLVAVYEDDFNFLTKMCLAAMREACCRMIAGARSAGARVIVAGSDATDAPEPYLRAGAEVALVGEGLQPQTLWTKLFIVPVTIPPGDVNMTWLHVQEEMTVPRPSAQDAEAYVIYVGFDPEGATGAKPKPAAKPKTARGHS